MEGKTRFMVEIPHSKDQCMQMLEDIKDKTPEILNKIEWGCMDNNHIGFAIVDANSKDEVKKMLPEKERSKVKITKLEKFSKKQIEELHREHA